MSSPTTTTLPPPPPLPDGDEGALPLDAATVAAQQEAAQEATRTGLARATGINAAGNISSRVLGLARDVVLSNLFGPSLVMDAFNVATIVPRALYDLLIGGHVNSALVPVFSQAADNDAERELWPLVSALLTLLTAITALLVLALEVGAPFIVGWIVDADTGPALLREATALLRLTAPALLFLGVFALLSSTLVALRRFTWPAFAGAVFNGVIVLVSVLLTPRLGIRAVALGWLLGALAQVLLQLPGLRRANMRWLLRWSHPGVRQVVALYLPVMASLIIDTLVIRFFSYRLAANQPLAGGITYMTWATTLIQFPQGLVATAISVAILPTLSIQAADASRAAFKSTLGQGLRLATVLILPAAVGLMVLAQPIVALIFEHGAFTVADTGITVLALRLYLLGLPFAALDLLLVYAFYARQDTLTPALVGVLSLLVYMVVAVTLMPRYGLFSLMIADSVKHLVHTLVSAYLLWRRLEGLGGQRLVGTALRAGVAAGVMGLVGWWVWPQVARVVTDGGLLGESLLVIISTGLCALVFFTLAWLLRVEELTWLVGAVRRRLTR